MSSQFGPSGQPPIGQQYSPGKNIPPYVPPIPGAKARGSGSGVSGCLIGCLAVAGIIIIVVVGGSWYAVHWVKKNVPEQTALTIKVPELTEKQQAELASKIKPVTEAFKNDTAETLKLTLTQDEVTWLMNQDEVKDDFKGSVEFPEDGIASFRISIVPGAGKKGGPPYINMEGKCELEIADGKVKMKILEGHIGKLTPGKTLLDPINQGISDGLQTNKDLAIYWDRLRELKIEKGQVNLTLRALKLPTQTTAPATKPK